MKRAGVADAGLVAQVLLDRHPVGVGGLHGQTRGKSFSKTRALIVEILYTIVYTPKYRLAIL